MSVISFVMSDFGIYEVILWPIKERDDVTEETFPSAASIISTDTSG